jgi:transposase
VIAALQRRVADFEECVRDRGDRLAQDSPNSSLPPSASPPDAPKPVVKHPAGQKPRAQPDHWPHLHLPPARGGHVIPHVPHHCGAGQATLPADAGPVALKLSWHHVVELPKIRAMDNMRLRHTRTCPGCGRVTPAPIPADLSAHNIGPNLAATLSYLSGHRHLNTRAVEELAEPVVDVLLALGSVSALE